MTPIGGSLNNLSYDLNGNMTGDGSSVFTYDATNRLLSIAGLVTASYGYDALDRRMAKTHGGTTTRFLHAGADEIAEYTSAGALLRRYVPGPGADERAVMIDSGSASPPATSIKYPITDRQGSVMAVTSSTGAVTERFAYDGFGRSNAAASGYPFRYTGQRLDPETGLMFYKARVYSQSLGRFLQTDPIGTKDDLNLYAYVGNDPVNLTDPTGMAPPYLSDPNWSAQMVADGYWTEQQAAQWNRTQQNAGIAIVLWDTGAAGYAYPAFGALLTAASLPEAADGPTHSVLREVRPKLATASMIRLLAFPENGPKLTLTLACKAGHQKAWDIRTCTMQTKCLDPGYTKYCQGTT